MELLSYKKDSYKKESLSRKTPPFKKTILSNNIEEFDNNENLVFAKLGTRGIDFLRKNIDFKNNKNFLIETSTKFNIDQLDKGKFDNIINFKKINDARYVNKFLESVNLKLDINNHYISCVETYATRRERLLKKYKKPFNFLYNATDFIFMRVFPKLPIAKKIYFFLTKGKNRVLTRAEIFGRIYSCGFEIVDFITVNNLLYFVAQKVKNPVFDNNPSYGVLVRLKRVGKDGKTFNVFKLRTMHAYAEYLQEYVHKHNSLKEGGKFKDDFRVTNEGKLFRKFWLDELPMLINLLKGEMKLVGVRPLSSHYFGLYTKELQLERIKTKPGLIPPFYSDMPKNLDEIIESELKYLKAYQKNPIKTDIKYFYKAFYNIFFNGARSS